MEAFLPYWLQRRRNKKMMRRASKRATLGEKEMPLANQVRLEADMSTYLVSMGENIDSLKYHIVFLNIFKIIL